MAQNIEEKNTERKKATLRDFFEHNEQLISGFGVFTAFAIFSLQLPETEAAFSLVMSFLLLWISGRILLELLKWLSNHKPRPFGFEILLISAFSLVPLYWVYKFWPYLSTFLASIFASAVILSCACVVAAAFIGLSVLWRNGFVDVKRLFRKKIGKV